MPLWTAIGPYPHHRTSKYFIIINIIWINGKTLWTEWCSKVSPNLVLQIPFYSLKLINISCKYPNHIFGSSLLRKYDINYMIWYYLYVPYDMTKCTIKNGPLFFRSRSCCWILIFQFYQFRKICHSNNELKQETYQQCYFHYTDFGKYQALWIQYFSNFWEFSKFLYLDSIDFKLKETLIYRLKWK